MFIFSLKFLLLKVHIDLLLHLLSNSCCVLARRYQKTANA